MRSWIRGLFNNSISAGQNVFFGGFGSHGVQWNNIYENKQNNQLLIDYFNNLAEVAAPILKYADGARQVKFETNIPEVEKLLNRPNYYQSWSLFFPLHITYKQLLGNSIVDAFSILSPEGGKRPESLYILSPEYIKIKVDKKEKDFRFYEVEKYIYETPEEFQNPIEIDPKNILHTKDPNPNVLDNQYLFGLSKYVGVSKNIESITEAYGAKVNLYKNGPRLIITGKGQGEFASINKGEKIARVQKRYKKYGWGKNDYNALITDAPLDVKIASLNVQQLQINENNKADFQRICDAQGIDSKVFSETSTFTNKAAALSEFYNGSFRSVIDGEFENLQLFLRQWWPTLILKPDYSQISEIVEANDKENKRLLTDAEKGLITRNDYLTSIGKEPVNRPDFNDYYYLGSQGWVSLTQNTVSNNTEPNPQPNE